MAGPSSDVGRAGGWTVRGAAYPRLFQDGATPSLVLAHGRRADHEGFQDSILCGAAAEGASGSEPGDEPSSVQFAAWIADDRRRTFLAGVGVGTIDQALLAVLPSRHAPLRLHGLHRRVLVVDEAHAGLAAAGVDATMFHARFAMGDRLGIEESVMARFGRGRTDRSGVVVASQVIEQSLDIDFDLLVTDLAPMDLMLQRAGRLWRHKREGRLEDQPCLLVLSPEPVDVPGADWLGPALRRAGFIEAPSKVRELVEAGYDDDVPPGLQHQANAAAGKSSAGASLVKQNLLRWEAGYDINAGAWASDIRTPTRLGEEGVTLRLGRWDGARLNPWCQADTPARAWSLSEVQVGKWLATRVPSPEGVLARAVAQAREGWGRWDRDIPLLALSCDGQDWVGSVVKGEQVRPVRNGSQTGLRFG